MYPILTPLLGSIDTARSFAVRLSVDVAEADRVRFVARMEQDYGYKVPLRREEWLPYELAALIVDYNDSLEKLRYRLLDAEWANNKSEAKAIDPEEPLLPQVDDIIADYGATLTRRINAVSEKQRQRTEGVTYYIWRTSGDDRVRGSHADNNGKTFRWDSPPDTGHPGDDYNCRCYAEPVALPNDPPIEPVYPVESLILGGAVVRSVIKKVIAEIIRRRDGVGNRDVEWKLGKYKSKVKWKNQMEKRNWTDDKITDTIRNGKRHRAPNKVNTANEAIRYEHNGKYVVRDEVTKEILQVSGDGFIPNK